MQRRAQQLLVHLREAKKLSAYRISNDTYKALENRGAAAHDSAKYSYSISWDSIWALECSPSFFRILRTWFATVCSEIESSKAIWRLLSSRATRSATSRSRRGGFSA